MTLIKIQTSTSGESPRKRKTRKKTRNQKIMYNMQILLKPSIKTTCSEWYGGVGPYFVFLCICSGHLSRHCFCQAIAVAVNRSAAERYVAGVSPLRLTFSQLFPSDFRRPLALRYRQAKGWGGYIFYWSSLGKVCVWVSAVLWKRATRHWQAVRELPTNTDSALFCQDCDGLWFLLWLLDKNQTKATKADKNTVGGCDGGDDKHIL